MHHCLLSLLLVFITDTGSWESIALSASFGLQQDSVATLVVCCDVY